MRSLISIVNGCVVVAAACLAAACGGDSGEGTLPVITAGMSSPVTGGVGILSAGVGASAAGTSGTVAVAGRAAAAGTGVLAGVGATAGASGVAGGATAGRGAAGSTAGAGAAGTGGAAGTAVAGSGGRAAGSGGSGGATAGSGGQAGGGAGGATFTAVYKIFMTNCAGATCHVGAASRAGGLAMPDQMTAYMNLVGVNSTSCSGEKRVVASDPVKSELVHTLDRTQIGTCGTRTPKMPDNKPKLAQADIDTVKAWVQAGAPNN